MLWILIPALFLAGAFVLILVLVIATRRQRGGRHGVPPVRRGQLHDAPGALHDDTDPNAPKTITSKEIQSFRHEFNPGAVYYGYKWDREILYQYLSFAIERQEGGAQCYFKGVGHTEEASFEITFMAPVTALHELQAIVDALNLAVYNGRRRTVGGIPPYYGGLLLITYASGERIYAYRNDSVVISNADSVELLLFLHNLARKAGQDFLYPPKAVEEIQGFLADRWENADSRYALELGGHSLKIYEGNALADDTTYYFAFKKIYNEQTENGRFKEFVRFEQRDDCLIGIREDGGEIVFRRCPAAGHKP